MCGDPTGVVAGQRLSGTGPGPLKENSIDVCYDRPMIGRHILLDVWKVDPVLLDDAPEILRLLREACEESGAEVLHMWTRNFTPQGVTALIGLAESHASAHTYPEHGYVAIDIFTCGGLDPYEAAKNLIKKLGGEATGWQVIRGELKVPVLLASSNNVALGPKSRS